MTKSNKGTSPPRFNIYKQGQELLAKELLEQLCPACSDDAFVEINNIFSYEYPEYVNRSDDPKLQIDMINEIIKAEQTFSQLFDVKQKH